MKKAFFNWSGGKDSALALYYALAENNYSIESLLTTLSEEYRRISMHGVRETLLDQQAKSIGIPLQKIYMPECSDMQVYNDILGIKLSELKQKNYSHSLFGDIFLEDLRVYREKQLSKTGIRAAFPIWKKNTHELINEFIDLGFKTIVTCIKEKYLDKSFAGRIIDRDFLQDLPAHVDPCGENGEFHTFVFEGPIFKEKIDFIIGEKTYRKYEDENNSQFDTGFWFCDLNQIS
jgi:uncharacterized protein (TIGR00290 family)